MTPTRNDGFSLSYPVNWRIYQDRTGMTIAPPAGVSQGAVAYGAVIKPANPNSASVDQAAQDVISSLEQSNSGLHASGHPQRVNGLEGVPWTYWESRPSKMEGRPTPEHDWLVVLPRPRGGMLYAVFISPERNFSELRSTYENMLRSLRLR